jgi:hypothetical protein
VGSGCDGGIKDSINNTPYTSLLGKVDGVGGDLGGDGITSGDRRDGDLTNNRERGIFVKAAGGAGAGAGIVNVGGSQSFSPIKPTRRGQTKGNVTL